MRGGWLLPQDFSVEKPKKLNIAEALGLGGDAGGDEHVTFSASFELPRQPPGHAQRDGHDQARVAHLFDHAVQGAGRSPR